MQSCRFTVVFDFALYVALPALASGGARCRQGAQRQYAQGNAREHCYFFNVQVQLVGEPPRVGLLANGKLPSNVSST